LFSASFCENPPPQGEGAGSFPFRGKVEKAQTEQETLCPEIDQEQDKALRSEVEIIPGETNPLAEFLSLLKQRTSSKKSRFPRGDLNDMLKNELGFGMKSRKYRTELFDIFVEYWCTTMPMNLRSLINDVERSVIIKILRKFNGNQRITAKALGINPTTLCEKLKKHRIYFRKAPFIEK
jgi:DNA-binding NtrC family response regulator